LFEVGAANQLERNKKKAPEGACKILFSEDIGECKRRWSREATLQGNRQTTNMKVPIIVELNLQSFRLMISFMISSVPPYIR
jgi:hypothetical protein